MRALFFALLAVALAAPAPLAAAKPAPIRGKLSRSGYTLIAMAANGAASSVRVPGHRFRLRPPAQRVTLQLRASNGTYAGPVVIARSSARKKRVRRRRVVVGVKAGARLGTITVRPGRHYASARGGLPRRWIDAKRWARARHGVPLGNGLNVGRVGGKALKRRVRPPGDGDADGVPDPIDVDNDGDLVLDDFDHSDGARGATASASSGTGRFSVIDINWIEHTVNANATGLTLAQADAALAEYGHLGFVNLPTDGSAELDCGGPVPKGLPYCAPGGTGTTAYTGDPQDPQPPFPACCDADGDGFGTLAAPLGLPAFLLTPHASTTQIHPDDLMIERFPAGGAENPPACTGEDECELPVTVPTILISVPALAAYGDSAGGGAPVIYPITAPEPGVMGSPGTFANPFPVKAGPDGHVHLTLTLWRPQRLPIPPKEKEGEWIDVGKLSYLVSAGHLPGSGTAPSRCRLSTLSTADPNLTPGSSTSPDEQGIYFGFMQDAAEDRPADPANTLTFSVDVTQCLAEVGGAWNPGEEAVIGVAANGLGTESASLGQLLFKRM